MQPRTRPAAGGQGPQMSPEASAAMQKIKATLKDAKLDELSERGSEKELAELLMQAEAIGKECARGIGKTQMMNVMGRVQAMGNAPTMADIRLLQAHLAYQVAKESRLDILKEALDPWFRRIDEQWGHVKDKEEAEREEWVRKVFGSLFRFVESIVAFHRYYEKTRGGA